MLEDTYTSVLHKEYGHEHMMWQSVPGQGIQCLSVQ